MSLFSRPATSILHPTDFSEASELAFAHALAIAIENKAQLRLLHVIHDDEDVVPWNEYPSVRKTLERWGKLESGSRRGEVASSLGIHVKKLFDVDKNVAQSIANLAEHEDVDLIVMATNEKRENPFWGKSSTSFKVSSRSQIPTLFVPQGVRGCVSIDDGSTSLNQVVIAVDHNPNAQHAIERITWALSKFGGINSQVTLLHVGEEDRFPHILTPSDARFQWTTVRRSGNAAQEIVAVAEEQEADLIVLVSEPASGFRDVLKGSTTRKVLEHAPCMVFAIPATGF